jgi:V/A-type H+-transporting ATPase subunit B
LVLSRPLHRTGCYPPLDVLPSLSRLMNSGIGEGRTRADHRELANQLYAAYANGRDLRKLVAIIGEEALSDVDRKYLKFAQDFEERMVNQGQADRSIAETLGLGWKLLSEHLPRIELKRIRRQFIDRYYTSAETDRPGGPEPTPSP